jgi:hypothetical protein
MKKLISLVLIISLLSYLTGCYSMKEVTKEDFHTDNERGKLKLITKENEIYEFEEGAYFIISDTLCGSGRKMSPVDTSSFDGKVALDDMEEIHMSKSDAIKSTIFGLFIVVFIATAMASILAAKDNHEE